jgi:hypothetical protein
VNVGTFFGWRMFFQNFEISFQVNVMSIYNCFNFLKIPKTFEYFPPNLLKFPHQNFGVENLKPKIKRMKKTHLG